MHTNLLLSLKITDDSRFCFAGVIRGSSELLAIDLGRLPVWGGNSNSNSNSEGASESSGDVVGAKRRAPSPSSQMSSARDLFPLIRYYRHNDPKLRGFGAAVRVIDEDNRYSSKGARYRLACGRGIKNIHIWQFVPSETGAPSWICMYDVPSNGNTIETICFPVCASTGPAWMSSTAANSGDGTALTAPPPNTNTFRVGYEVLSKSAGSNVRMWKLHQWETDPTSKIVYEDVPNSQDSRILVGGYAFGGTYDFAVVKLSAPKEANRDVFMMPERAKSKDGTDGGGARKRVMREIDQVIGSSDAKHVLALCTDGGVLYFRNGHDAVIIPASNPNANANASSCAGSKVGGEQA